MTATEVAPPATDPATPAAPAPITPEPTKAAPVETGKPEAETKSAEPAKAEKPAESKSEKADAPRRSLLSQAAEPKVDIKAPEGVEVAPSVLRAYGDTIAELGIEPAKAQQILDRVIPVMNQANADRWRAEVESWENEARADKEFGGANLENTLRDAAKFLHRFDPDKALREDLDRFGIGSRLSVMRALARAGRAIGEDRIEEGRGTGGGVPMSESAQLRAAFPDMYAGKS